MGITRKKFDTDCEVLAPAGSYQCMIAAINAGADAVYVGGNMFGARAYADNFSEEELISAIEYTHLRGKRLYLTVNTLIKERELENQLVDYLTPLYRVGLDAVIVQDMGVVLAVREHFPDMDIHASTQMTVTGKYFAGELKNLGVSRIVTARELSLSEIKDIYDATGLEIESFVHGALCYSYSGQCLLSSLIGGRSGNRGRCAGPCRLAYDLYDGGKKINSPDERYILSPKDICTIELLPDILKAGVYSLKIEGRMKKPEYVAAVTAAYRKYADLAREDKPYKVDERDIDALKEIYNRGGFTDGYYKRHNGREIMSLYKPNHYGRKVAEILNASKGQITAKATDNIDPTDVLEINLSGGEDIQIKQKITAKKGQNFAIKNDMTLNGKKCIFSMDDIYEPGIFRTRNNMLIADIENNIIKRECKVGISGKMTVRKGQSLRLKAWLKAQDRYGVEVKVEAECEGDEPDTADSRPASPEDIRAKLCRTGNTDFYFDRLDIEVDDNLFVPVSVINDMRRQCIDRLREKAAELWKRQTD